MIKYSKNDIELVLERYYKYQRIPVTSEIIRSNILKFADHEGNDTDYESLYPYTAIWKINSDCNLRCKHCYFYGSDEYSTKNDLSYERICDIIDQLSDLGIMEIRLTGGEVFLHKDIFKIIKYIKDKNIAIIITTNGTLITNEIAQELSAILSSNVDIIRISLDGANEETHDTTRGIGVFSKAIESIKILKQHGLRVFVSSVITTKNINELADIYSLLNNLEVEQVTYIKIVAIDESQKELIPTFEDIIYNSAKLYKSIRDTDTITIDNRLLNAYDFLQDDLSKELIHKYIKPMSVNDFHHCNIDKSFYIDADGTVYLCPLAADYKLEPLGGLKDMSLKKIFQNRKDNKLFQKQNIEQKKCKNCDIFRLCKGGCFMQAYLKHKSFPSTPC
ncbi:radical SAM protein [bacterium]|nr:radical SAM protein [bacterium]